jgi:hypothetical protein
MINFIDNLIHYHYNLELIMISKLTAINYTFTKQRKFSLFKNNNQLGYYLAGLIESDGSILTPKLNSENRPTISIIFNIKDNL